MGFLTVKRCCCFDLRTGGLIIVTLAIIFGASNIIQAIVTHNYPLLVSIIELVADGLCIYGILTDNHLFMLPSLILWALSLLALYIAPIVAIIFFTHALLIIDGFKVGITMLVVFTVTVYLIALLVTYFFIVLCSLYKQIKDSKMNAVHVHQSDPVYAHQTALDNGQQSTPIYVTQSTPAYGNQNPA